MLTRWTRARWVMETGKVPWHPHAPPPPPCFSALHMLCSTYCIRLQINMSVYASFIQTPSTVAADIKNRLGTSQTWSGDREEYRIWYVHALSSLFPCSRFFFLSFSQFLKVRISRKNIAYWILSKGRWHLSRFPPCVGWMELLSRRPLNSIKVWLFHNSTKQACVWSGTQKQRAAPVNLLSQGSVHIWCPSTGA